MAAKGKQIAEKTPPSKKRRSEEDDKSGKRKKKTPGVLQFFDVAADVQDDQEESSDDDFDLDFMEDDNSGQKEKCGIGKPHNLPFMPKEEELSDGELEMLLEERYKPGSKYVVYADDEKKTKGSSGKESLTKFIGDPIIWRVKCTVGRERRTAFCLIQKFVDLQSLGNKLKIVSAFAPDHIKGYIYVEAEKEVDILEACKGINNVYSSRISPVPKNEVGHLFSVRNTSIDVPVGTWVRVKLGRYKGDLAQVMTFDDARKSVTVKLIPRIDLQALTKKLAGGGSVKQTTIPAARVISSRDLEVLRSHVVLKRDRLTGEVFETIDGLMLKDGYLFKKLPIDSISYVDVVPTADELLKFKPYKKDASNDAEWLTHLYGEQRKKRLSDGSKGTTKSMEGTSGAKKGKEFQLHDLVFYGPKDFGVIIGVESDSFQIVKYDEVEGAEVVNVESHEIMSSTFDKKFTTLDQQMKVISINDTVRVLEGPFMGREGVAKHICKGTIFIYDKNQLENGGYFCAKPKGCENISSTDAHIESIGDPFGSGDGFGTQTFEDSMSCPKSPESSKKPWQEKENRQGDRDGGFSVGQTLRIRIGPLKGHLCRIVSMYRSDVTVKVDSQTKVLSVKREHLSEAGVKSCTKRQDGFATQAEPSGAQSESNGWDSLPLTTGRSSWSDLSTPGFLLDSSLKNPFDSLATTDGPEKGDDPWGSKESSKQPTDSWGTAVNSSGDHGKGDDPWGSKETSKQPTDGWVNALSSSGDIVKGDDPWGSKETSKKPSDSWGNAASSSGDLGKGDDPWGSKETFKKPTDSWGNAASSGRDLGKGNDPWGSKETFKKPTDSWGNAASSSGDLGKGNDPWGSKETSKKPTDSLGNAASSGGNLGKGDDPWGSKETSKPTDSWGNAVISSGDLGKGDDPWGSKETSNKPADSWGNAACSSGDLGKGGEGDDPWGTKRTSEKTTESWGNAVGLGEDRGKGKVEGDDPWGSTTTLKNEKDSSGTAVEFSGRVKKPTDSWVNAVSSGGDTGKGVEGDDTWSTKETSKKATESWGNAIGFGDDHGKGKNEAGGPWGGKQTLKEKTDSWGTAEGFGGDIKKPTDSWGNAVSSSGDLGKADPWGIKDISKKPSDTWGNAVSSGEIRGKGKAEGDDSRRSAAVAQNTDGWGSKVTNNKDTESSWGSEAGFSGDKKSSWSNTVSKQDGGDNLGKNAAGNGWGAVMQGVENNGQASREDSWNKATKNWKGTQSEPAGQTSNDSWSNQGTKDSWSNKNDNDGDGGSGWNRRKGREECSTDDQQDGWNKPRNFDGGRGSGGRRGRGEYRGGNRDQSGRGRSFGRGRSSGSNDENCQNDFKFGSSSGNNDQSDGWKKNNSFGGHQGSSWGNSSSDAGGNKSSGWGSTSGAAVADGNKSSGWGNASNWNTPNDSVGGTSSDWNKGKSSDANQTSGWDSGASDAGGNKSSGWGSGSNQLAGWNQGVSTEDKSNNWRGGKSFGGGRTSGWGAGPDGGGGESSNGSNRGRGFGRGGSNRGGFSNRGHHNGGGESTDFSNRGGGFNRGGSSGASRGGFGNRGRGRRDASTESAGWNKSERGDDDQWGSKGTPKNNSDSWSNAAGSNGGAGWGDAAGSSGGSGWGNAAGSSGGSGWGNAASSSGYVERGDTWGSKETSKKAPEGWGTGTGKGGW